MLRGASQTRENGEALVASSVVQFVQNKGVSSLEASTYSEQFVVIVATENLMCVVKIRTRIVCQNLD